MFFKNPSVQLPPTKRGKIIVANILKRTFSIALRSQKEEFAYGETMQNITKNIIKGYDLYIKKNQRDLGCKNYVDMKRLAQDKLS